MAGCIWVLTTNGSAHGNWEESNPPWHSLRLFLWIKWHDWCIFEWPHTSKSEFDKVKQSWILPCGHWLTSCIRVESLTIPIMPSSRAEACIFLSSTWEVTIYHRRQQSVHLHPKNPIPGCSVWCFNHSSPWMLPGPCTWNWCAPSSHPESDQEGPDPHW